MTRGLQSLLGRRETAQTAEERLYTASQAQLIWWRFRRHKLAIVGASVLTVLYALASTRRVSHVRLLCMG